MATDLRRFSRPHRPYQRGSSPLWDVRVAPERAKRPIFAGLRKSPAPLLYALASGISVAHPADDPAATACVNKHFYAHSPQSKDNILDAAVEGIASECDVLESCRQQGCGGRFGETQVASSRAVRSRHLAAPSRRMIFVSFPLSFFFSFSYVIHNKTQHVIMCRR